MKPMKLSLLTLLLAGCSTQTPNTPTVPVPPSKTNLVEVQFSGAGTVNPTSALHPLDAQGVSKQGLTEISGLTITYNGAESYNGKNGTTRYLQAYYRVTNNTGQILYNLGFIPVVLSDTDGDANNNSRSPTLAGTPYASVKYYDGTAAPASTAQGITATYAVDYDDGTDSLVNRTTTSTYRSGVSVADYTPTNPAGLEITELKNYGWKFQEPLADGASAIMTFSVTFPIPSDKKLAPYSFSLIAAFTEGVMDAGFYGSDLTVDPTRRNRNPDMALDSRGHPIVVWDEKPTSGSSDAHVKCWTGTTWEQLGGVVGFSGTSSSTNPAIALDAANQPFVAYGSGANTHVKRWSGTDWVQLGGSLTSTNYTVRQDIAVNSQGQPVVSYQAGSEAYVKGWNGTDWVQLGSSLRVNPFGSDGDTVIVLDEDDRPVVAFVETLSDEGSNVHVQSWNGTGWVQLGPALDINLTRAALVPDVALDLSWRPVVTWAEEGSNNQFGVYVKRWNGTSWELLGSALNVNVSDSAYNPSVKINTQGQPVVVFEEGDGLVVKTWNGSTWVQGSSTYSAGTGSPTTPAFVLDGDTPVVTWIENKRTYVQR